MGDEPLGRSDWARDEVSTAIRADTSHLGNARRTERAFVGADACIRRLRGQVDIATFAAGSQIQDGHNSSKEQFDGCWP